MSSAGYVTSDPTILARSRRAAGGLVDREWPVALLAASAFLLLWHWGSVTGRLPRSLIPPHEVAAATVDLVRSEQFLALLLPSLRRAGLGFVIGAGLGVLLGLLSGTFRGVEDTVDLPIAFSYPIPKIALFPVFAVWLGFTDTNRILVIALACFYPAYLNAVSGTRAIDPNYLWVARNVGSSRVRTFLQVIAPAAMPRTFAGLQISLAISFIVLFAVETIGFSDGIASYLFRSFQDGFIERTFAGVVVLGVCGYLANSLLLWAGRRFVAGVESIDVSYR